MSEALLLRLDPGDLASGRPYVERDERPPAWHDELALGLWHGVARPAWRQFSGHSAGARRVVALTRSHEAEMAALDYTGLRTRAAALRHALRRSHFGAAPTAQFFALLREVATRVLGKRHYDSQVHAGWLLLQGALVEMATGRRDGNDPGFRHHHPRHRFRSGFGLDDCRHRHRHHHRNDLCRHHFRHHRRSDRARRCFHARYSGRLRDRRSHKTGTLRYGPPESDVSAWFRYP